MTWLKRPRTSMLWPLMALPMVSSANAVNFTLPRLLAHEPFFMPSTTALGQSCIEVEAVCTSPLGSLKVTSAVISLGFATVPKSFSVKVAAPFLSVVNANLSAMSLPFCDDEKEGPEDSLSSSPPLSDLLGSRGGSNVNSSYPLKWTERLLSSALARAGAMAMPPPEK